MHGRNGRFSQIILIVLVVLVTGGALLLIRFAASSSAPTESPSDGIEESASTEETPAHGEDDLTSKDVTTLPTEETPHPELPLEDRMEATAAAEVEPPEPRLYLILDDAGYSMDELRLVSAFQHNLTMAVLPALPHSVDVARSAADAGLEVMLHQPMEAINGEDPGPGAILLDQSEEMVRSIVRRNLRELAGIQGVNNHMGSSVTADFSFMTIILDTLREEGVPFLDSRTTAASVAVEAGAALGLTVAQRDVFLDHVRSREAIENQLDLALLIAREKGYAVMIGHITVPETIAVLVERQEEIVEQGFRFYPVSDLFQRIAEAP